MFPVCLQICQSVYNYVNVIVEDVVVTFTAVLVFLIIFPLTPTGSAVWIKLNDEDVFEKVLFLGSGPVDKTIDLAKYGYNRNGKTFTLLIKNVTFEGKGVT